MAVIVLPLKRRFRSGSANPRISTSLPRLLTTRRGTLTLRKKLVRAHPSRMVTNAENRHGNSRNAKHSAKNGAKQNANAPPANTAPAKAEDGGGSTSTPEANGKSESS